MFQFKFMPIGVILFSLIVGAWARPLEAAQDIVIADFEGGSYPSQWQVEGTAFGNAPAPGTLPSQQKVSGFLGNGLVNSYLGRDASQGTLTSSVFTIERDFINFRIGGGKDFSKVGMRLIHDGSTVQTASGNNNEKLDQRHWDVKNLRGQAVKLEIFDKHKGSWGHINVDHIIQSDTAEGELLVPMIFKTREIPLSGKLILLPISRTSESRTLSIAVDGKLVHRLDSQFADQPDDVAWWAYLDMKDSQGKVATVNTRTTMDSQLLDLIESSDERRDLVPMYTEKLRPQLRFSQMQGWNNDPNGMMYYDGEYHFFWQANPVGLGWANMYWGHAVSTDLIHWKELPRALRPNGKGEKARAVNMADGMCWSGGGVVDFNNTLGKQVGDTKTLITTFTDTIAGERMAYSTDKGRTWTVDDVLIRHHGRDPKPFWYEPGKHWNIIAWSASDSEREKFNLPKLDKGGHAIYKSKDFKTWKQSGFVNNFYECPEMFELPVDGDKDNTRWVVFGAASLYRVGQFDGNQFAADNPDAQDQKVFYGPVYAGQIFSNTPDDRKIYVAWAKVNTTTPDAAFSQGFTLPLELTLHTTDDGLKLFANPIEEFKQLRQEKIADWNGKTISVGDPELQCDLSDKIAEVELKFKVTGNPERLILRYGTDAFAWDFNKQTIGSASAKLKDGKGTLRLIIDRPYSELIVNDGAAYELRHRRRDAAGGAGEPLDRISLQVIGNEGSVTLTDGAVYQLKSIWNKD